MFPCDASQREFWRRWRRSLNAMDRQPKKEVSLSDDVLMVRLAYSTMVAAVALVALVLYLGRKMKRRAENKVRTSDLVLLTDIEVLAKSNSQLLDDAVNLRCAQMEQRRSPGD